MLRALMLVSLSWGVVTLNNDPHTLALSTDLSVETRHARGKAVSLDAPEVFPVPTASRCIVIMVCQYMIIYTALAICRIVQEFMGIGKGAVEMAFDVAAQTLTYCPMICVLFIAARMRVEHLSHGAGQPPMWVQNCMYAMTFAVLASSLSVLFITLATGKPVPVNRGTPDLEQPQMSESGNKIVFYAMTALRYLIFLGLYGGVLGVIIGICTYLPPGAANLAELPQPAPAVVCTMILAVVFFAIQLVIALCRTYNECTGREFPKLVEVMNGAMTAVEFAPMIAIVFLAARMRALQHEAQPQQWAQHGMYVATLSVCTTTLISVLVPLMFQEKPDLDPADAASDLTSRSFGYVMEVIRYLCLFGLYGGIICVIYSIYAFQAPDGPEATLPVSPTVQCVVQLTTQYFFVYSVLVICLTVSEVSSGRFPLDQSPLYSALQAAKTTVAFAPMLSILFVTTRMYALAITNKKGAPQAWVQDGMYLATFSLLVSFLSCIFTAFAMDEVKVDEDGNVVNKFENNYVGGLMIALRLITMLFLYGGIVIVVVGLFTMTPETANGRGSIPVVSDVAAVTATNR